MTRKNKFYYDNNRSEIESTNPEIVELFKSYLDGENCLNDLSDEFKKLSIDKKYICISYMLNFYSVYELKDKTSHRNKLLLNLFDKKHIFRKYASELKQMSVKESGIK